MLGLGKVGPLELVVILIIAILVFGPGRIGKIGAELGQGIRGFKDGLKTDEEKPEVKEMTEEATTADA